MTPLVFGLVVVALDASFVLDVSNKSRIGIDGILDRLFAAIGEKNLVRSLGLVTFAGLVVTQVYVGRVILDVVVVFVVGWWLYFIKLLTH